MNKVNFNKVLQPFHLMNASPWPILISIGSLLFFSGFMNWILVETNSFLLWTLFYVLSIIILWFRDVRRESLIGFQIGNVNKIVKLGMFLFILSEILFFFSFFWSFFHSTLSHSSDLGLEKVLDNLTPFDPFCVPLLNTFILYMSGITITTAHFSLMQAKFIKFYWNSVYTLILGFYFLTLQVFEYSWGMLTFSDTIIGSLFYLMTGFHGFHVMLGLCFIIWMLVHTVKGCSYSTAHTSLICAAWYWHFVDVVWLFLFIFVYLRGI